MKCDAVSFCRLTEALRLSERRMMEGAQANERQRTADLSLITRQLEANNKELKQRLDDNNDVIRVANQQIAEKHQECIRYLLLCTFQIFIFLMTSVIFAL
jgi:hypothetical protein